VLGMTHFEKGRRREGLLVKKTGERGKGRAQGGNGKRPPSSATKQYRPGLGGRKESLSVSEDPDYGGGDG